MSQTMSNEIQAIHYCTILSAGQWDFLLEGRFSPLRQKCLYRLMNGAVRTRTAYKIKGIDIVLEVGQVAASDVELAEFLDCNRKTVGKLIDSFNSLGMLTTKTNNRTSVHSLHFLTGWYVGGVLVTNPHYVRPSAAAKGQTGDVRTPVSDSLPSGDEPGGAAVDCHTRGKETDTLATARHPFLLPFFCQTVPIRQPMCMTATATIRRPICSWRTQPQIGISQTVATWHPAASAQGATARRRTARMAARLLRHRLGRSGSAGRGFERYSVVVG